MVWRRGDSQDSFDATREDPATPWRRGAARTPEEQASQVAVEKWDDEIPQPTRAEEAAAAARWTLAQVSPATRHALGLLAFTAAVIGALAGIGVAWMHVVGDPLADAHAYYEAASRLNAGEPLYPKGIDPSSNHIYLYPPLLAVALRPLALLPFEWFALAWELVVVASFVALLRYLGVRRRSTWLAVGMLGVPIAWALTVAQAHLPMTWLMALGQPWSIAIAANIKLFPALIALWWFARRDWQALGAFVVWCGLLALAQLALEADGSFAFFRSVGFDQLGEVRNISPFTLSPWLWAGLLAAGCLAILATARTRWGWSVAVTIATLAPPRLLIYMLTGLLAALREPRPAGADETDDNDPAAIYRRATR